MSKEELLKYLIAEIDLIMHDKDYRFENEDGTWYSRESCRNLTNEEVFEELRTELRQLADIEAKLAEKETEYNKLKQCFDKANENCTFDELREIILVGEENSNERVIKMLNEQVEALEQQLAEKEEIIEWQNEIVEGVKQEEELLAQKLKSLGVDCIEDLGKEHHQDKISFAVEQLIEIRDYVKECWGLDKLEGKVRLDIAKKIRLKIEQLKEGK